MTTFTEGDPGHVDEHNRLASVFDPRRFGTLTDDGSTDCYAAFKACLDEMDAYASAANSYGCEMRIPHGRFRISAPLEVQRSHKITGASGSGRSAGTVIAPDAGVNGFILHNTTTSADGGSAQWAKITDLALIARSKATADTDAIQVFARAELSNLFIKSFSGRGIAVLGGLALGPGGENTNANLWRLWNTRIELCDGHAFHTIGADANAGVAIGLDCTNNGGNGICDESFLGNTYVGCHARDSGGRNYETTRDTATNMFLGCYSESGAALPNKISYPSMWLGGIEGGGWDTATLGGILTAGQEGLRAQAMTTLKSAIEVRIPSETRQRFRLMGDGKLRWYDGENTTDIASLNATTIEMKSPDGTRYKLTPPNGGGTATWIAV